MTDTTQTIDRPAKKRRQRRKPRPTAAQPIEQTPVDLPTIDQLETTLEAAGVNLHALAIAHTAAMTYQFLTGSQDATITLFSSIVAAGVADPVCEQYAATLGSWFALRAIAYAETAERLAESMP